MSVDEVYHTLSKLKTNDLRQLTKEYGIKSSRHETKNDLILDLLFYPYKNFSGGAYEEVVSDPENIPWNTLPDPAIKTILEKLSRADIGRLRQTSKKIDERLKKMATQGPFFRDLMNNAHWSIPFGQFIEKPVFDLAWNPNGKQIASIGSEISDTDDFLAIMIWDVNTGKQVGRKIIIGPQVSIIAWSAGGKYLANVYSHTGDNENDIIDKISIWDAKTQEPIETPIDFTEFDINDLAWHPSDEPILASAGTHIIIWNVETGHLGTINPGFPFPVKSIDWHPEGNLIASGGHDIKFWDTETFQQIGNTIEYEASVVAWSPDGSRLASGGYDEAMDGGRIKFWNPVTQMPIGDDIQHSSIIFSMAWHPNGRYIAFGDDMQTVILWDTQTGEKEILNKTVYSSELTIPVNSLVWSPKPISENSDKRYLAAAIATEIKFWAR